MSNIPGTNGTVRFHWREFSFSSLWRGRLITPSTLALVILVLVSLLPYALAWCQSSGKEGGWPRVTDFMTRFGFFEINGGASYRHNDFYAKDLAGYGISESVTSAGMRISSISSKTQVEAYLRANIVYDIFDEVWNKVDWHNNYTWGVGVRIRQVLKNLGLLRQIHANEFNLEVFIEKLWIGYPRSGFFYIGHRPEDDLKFGLKYWLDIGSKNKIAGSATPPTIVDRFFWESAGSIYYSKSSFYIITQQGYYLVDWLNRLGLRTRIANQIFLEPYLKNSLIYDFGKNNWNHLDWQNFSQYGAGIRCKYYRLLEYRMGESNLVVGPFYEVLTRKYFKNVNYVPGYRPANDYRAGIEIWLMWSGTNI